MSQSTSEHQSSTGEIRQESFWFAGQRTIHLQTGRMAGIGPSTRMSYQYLSKDQQKAPLKRWDNMEDPFPNNFIGIHFVELVPHLKIEDDPICIRTRLTVRFEFISPAAKK